MFDWVWVRVCEFEVVVVVFYCCVVYCVLFSRGSLLYALSFFLYFIMWTTGFLRLHVSLIRMTISMSLPLNAVALPSYLLCTCSALHEELLDVLQQIFVDLITFKCWILYLRAYSLVLEWPYIYKIF